jgi:hypothetical protein
VATLVQAYSYFRGLADRRFEVVFAWYRKRLSATPVPFQRLRVFLVGVAAKRVESVESVWLTTQNR